MKTTIIALITTLAITGCAGTAFSRTKTTYMTPDTIGVRYMNSGLINIGEEDNAMALIVKHCRGEFKVTSRTVEDGYTYVDATCKTPNRYE